MMYYKPAMSHYYGQVKLWDVATKQERLAIEVKPGTRYSAGYGSTGVYSLAFSRDGKSLAAGCWEMLKQWDVATGQEQATRDRRGYGSGYGSHIAAVAFSRDGDLLAAACRYEYVFVWNATR